jgi:hypothetical protein
VLTLAQLLLADGQPEAARRLLETRASELSPEARAQAAALLADP